MGAEEPAYVWGGGSLRCEALASPGLDKSLSLGWLRMG